MNRYGLLLLCSILAIAGCRDDDTNAAQPLAEIKLYVFDCGRIRFDSIENFSIADDEIEIRILAASCYVIEHDNGRLLWDGGLPPKTADVDDWQGDGVSIRLDRTLADQLSDIDLTMSSFDYVAFSHMHFDHVGVANEVEGAQLIIQQAEYDAAFADPVTIPATDPSLYSNLRDTNSLLIDGDHDVFGDGRVIIISAPGHTPGHQVLFVDLEETGPIVLSGDLYHFALSRQERRIPVFNVDAAATLESMDRVDALLAETGAELWIQHELARFETLDKSPLHYD